jgi:hypothetical protein
LTRSGILLLDSLLLAYLLCVICAEAKDFTDICWTENLLELKIRVSPEADSLLSAAEVRKYSILNSSILLEAIFQIGVGLNYTDTYFNHYLYAIKHPLNFFYFNLDLLRDDFSY